jgi:uncharacterized protein
MNAAGLFSASRPRSPEAHLVRHASGGALFLANRSRIFDVDRELADAFDAALAAPRTGALAELLAAHGLVQAPAIEAEAPRRFAVRALSLAIAQKCNLGCTYCYAQGGEFGAAPKSMGLETARQSVDLLLGETAPGERANLAFLGGEPLVARDVLRETTRYAAERAAAAGIRLRFSITTNGTLLRDDDADFFERYGFAVTISIDGIGEAHDRLRPTRGGRGSYERILARVGPLLERQRRMQVSARVTATPRNLALRETLETLLGIGFHSVGFSPMLSSPSGLEEMDRESLAVMLDAMIDCAGAYESALIRGERYGFQNAANAMRELHRGTHRPYPCGAGAGYLGVSAEGDLAACHRFVGDEAGAMGDLTAGVDRERQEAWLSERFVDRQQPCSGCWARYLCGGGCHHETLSRGRPACDFIRGWLHHCLGLYSRLAGAGGDVLARAV